MRNIKCISLNYIQIFLVVAAFVSIIFIMPSYAIQTLDQEPAQISKYPKTLGDFDVRNLTITEKRLNQVDFSNPVYWGVNEILVTHYSSPQSYKIEHLNGMEFQERCKNRMGHVEKALKGAV